MRARRGRKRVASAGMVGSSSWIRTSSIASTRWAVIMFRVVDSSRRGQMVTTRQTTGRWPAGRSTSAARHCYSVLTTRRTGRSMIETARPGSGAAAGVLPVRHLGRGTGVTSTSGSATYGCGEREGRCGWHRCGWPSCSSATASHRRSPGGTASAQPRCGTRSCACAGSGGAGTPIRSAVAERS